MRRLLAPRALPPRRPQTGKSRCSAGLQRRAARHGRAEGTPQPRHQPLFAGSRAAIPPPHQTHFAGAARDEQEDEVGAGGAGGACSQGIAARCTHKQRRAPHAAWRGASPPLAHPLTQPSPTLPLLTRPAVLPPSCFAARTLGRGKPTTNTSTTRTPARHEHLVQTGNCISALWTFQCSSAW